MKTQTFRSDRGEIVLVNGHIHLLEIAQINPNDYWIYLVPTKWETVKQEGPVKSNLPTEWFEKLHDKDNYRRVIATTNPGLNLPLLDRNLFVRGVEELAEKRFPNTELISGKYPKVAKSAFIEGYQANKAEFTRDDMERALSEAFKADQEGYQTTTKEIIQSLKPLSLPKEVVVEVVRRSPNTMMGFPMKEYPKTKDGKVVVVDVKW